jgi:hypothetical protein
MAQAQKAGMNGDFEAKAISRFEVQAAALHQ